MTETIENTEVLAVSIPKAVQITSLSRSTIYKMISDGELKKRKLGNRTVILIEDLRNLLQNAPSD
ncbi:helix-turn-helix transcriptional regulator [Hoeflea sp. TYP-13]|uniref:helix-turn-helix transcriptional regulator n=1 Tax=Hoeflea sp. TYP-13 TaxID=3230023 RepID=UPI0034C6C680